MCRTVAALPGQDIIVSSIPNRIESLTYTPIAKSIPREEEVETPSAQSMANGLPLQV
jgi:hypothetical protein